MHHTILLVWLIAIYQKIGSDALQVLLFLFKGRVVEARLPGEGGNSFGAQEKMANSKILSLYCLKRRPAASDFANLFFDVFFVAHRAK
jgi:hypothetical protein